MFFVLSKVVFFLITPSNLLIALALAGVLLLLATGLRRTGGALALVGAAGLALAGLSPLSAVVLLPLEQRFPPYPEDGPAPDGIVVLGGGVETELSEARGQVVVNDAGERPIYLAALARRYPGARLVFSGGSGFVGGGVSEADVVARHAATLGVARDRLILERESRNTRENAAFSADLVRPRPGQRWLLVTSAGHMPRAVGCFRRAGFTVDAFPVDYRTAGWGEAWRFNGFSSDGLMRLDLAVKEWIGLVAYRVMGYTGDWLPGPAVPPGGGSASR